MSLFRLPIPRVNIVKRGMLKPDLPSIPKPRKRKTTRKTTRKH